MTIHRDDLEAKLREIEAVVDETKRQARATGTVVAAVVVAVVIAAFIIGRRKGRRAGGARIEVYQLK